MKQRRVAAIALAALLALSAAPAHAAESTATPKPKPEPVLVLKSYKTTPPELSVGNRFKLEVVFDNVVNADADNVVVTVGTSSAAATATPGAGVPDVVVLGSNNKFLGTIDGEAKNIPATFDMVSNAGGSAGPSSIPVTVQFDNPNGGRITQMMTVGVMLTRTLVFDVGSLSYPRGGTVGKPFNVSVTVKNTNEFPINGVALAFDAPGADWVSRESTVGVLESAKDARFVGTGIPREPGPLLVTLSISYKDDYNELKQIRREFSIAVKPKPAEPPAREPEKPGTLVARFLMALVGLGG